MLDEEKTKKQLIDELAALRLRLVAGEGGQHDGGEGEKDLRQTLAWKDFLLGLHEQSFHITDNALYTHVLDQVVHLTGSTIGFFHLVSEDQQTITLTTWNDEALKSCKAPFDTHYPVEQAGNWVDCLRLKRPVVYNEFAQAPNRKGLPPGHNPLRRFMSVPVIEHGQVRIIFGVGNKAEAYSDEDVFQTQLVAHNLQAILERRHADEQLRLSEERLSLTLQVTRDGIWDWDLLQGNGYASPSYYSMLSFKPSDISMNSEAWWRLIHPDDVEKVRQAIDRVKCFRPGDVGDAPGLEFRMKKKTGGWCWILARGKVVAWNGECRPLRMVGAHTDITKRKQAEEALRESEGKFRDLVEKSIAGVYLVQDGLFKYVNTKCAEIFGYSIDEIVDKKRAKDVIYEDDLPLVEENLRKRISGELKELHYGFRICAKSREIKYVEVYSSRTTYQGNPAVIGTLLDLTEKKRVEESLRESEEVFRLLFEKSGDANLLLEDGRFVDFNEMAMKVLACPDKSRLIHLSPADISPERQPDGALSSEKANQMMEIAFNEGSNHFEWVHRAFDGTEKYLDMIMTPISVRGKKILYVTWRDITERKRAEESLRQRETTLSSVFKATPVGLCIMKDRVFQSANKSWYDIFGYAEADIIGHTTRILYENEDEYERVGRELVAGLSESGFAAVQTKLRRKDGASRDATVIAAPLQPEDLTQGMVVTIEDITDRRRAEDELRESQRTLVDIIEFLPDATLVIDRYGKVLAWNRAMETMTGVKKGDMLGKGDYEYALPFYGMRRPILIDLALYQDQEAEKKYTAIQRWADALFGEAHTPNLPPGDIHLSVTASVLRDSNGVIIAAIECIRDITERIQLESQLRQAQKMEAIGTLAGGIAHDFNNILASLIGYTELAMMSGGKADLQGGYLKQVMKACDRAKNLVNQILVFSRQREQEKKPMDVKIIVKETLKLLRASLPTTIKINQQMPPDPLTIIADPTQIHQIVMNLCTNAAHAMQENGGVLEVFLSTLIVSEAMASINPGFKAGPYVNLTVKDTGYGIEAAVIDKIFDPFFTTKRHQEGTGLGLSVVYGIVKSYDGVIQVKSDPGQGATVNIFIPSTGEIKIAEVTKVEQAIPGGHESILLVDDEELLVLAMKKYLQSLGYDVVSLTSSPEALYMIQENPHRFALMLTDMTMPQMTGLKLSKKILAINPEMPIILCTGYNESITEAEAKETGIREFVLKPIPLQKIARLVRQVLDRP